MTTAHLSFKSMVKTDNSLVMQHIYIGFMFTVMQHFWFSGNPFILRNNRDPWEGQNTYIEKVRFIVE